MADTKAEEKAEEMNNYAAKHPRRMYSSLFMLGTAIGAGLMAAKKNHDKNALQKFIDQIGHH
jgi:hypothetical protein